MKTKKALFIGRWQPFHKGHRWLIDQKLKQGIPVLIAVRDVPPDKANPFTTQEVVEMLNVALKHEDVEIIVIPDIESVNYGRGVGYEINEFSPPPDIEVISATAIRNDIKQGSDHWKRGVDENLISWLLEYYN